MISQLNIEDMVSKFWSEVQTTMLIVTLILLAVSLLAYKIINLITRPLGAINNSMLELLQGNTEIEVSFLNRNDEIGNMSRTVEVFRKSAIEQLKLEADKNQTNKADVNRQQAIDDLIESFKIDVNNGLEMVAKDSEQMKQIALVVTDM